MLTEKEKLEEELKLLEESLSLDVITKEEFEYAKQRIEAKLNKLKASEQEKEPNEKINEEPEPKEEAEEPEQEEYKAEEAEEESEKEAEIKKEELAEEKEEQEEGEEQKRLEEAEFAEQKPEEDAGKEAIEEQPEIIFEKEKKRSKRIWAYIAIILILGFISGYFFLPGFNKDAISKPAGKPISLIACSSDEECVKEGSIGTCNNPGKENAECEYIEDIKIKLTVLNSGNCFNCETGRVLSIIHGFFPNIDAENIDFETGAGKEIAEKLNIAALPAYILNSSLQEAKNYYKIYNAFAKVGNSFVVKNTAANGNYYIGREEMPNKLDLFIKQGQVASLEAEENLKEFLEAFEGKVDFEKHDSDDKIVKELGINTFPAFLVNNKIKFSGVQSADKIRENFCQLNSVAECALGLTKSLV